MKTAFCPSRTELLWGGIYLFLQATVIPVAVALVVAALPVSISLSMTNLILFGVNFLAVLLIFRRFLLKSLQDFFQTPLRCLGLAALGLAVYFPANLAGGMLLQVLGLSAPNVNDGAIMQMLQEDLLPMAISMVVMAPLTEELLYRSVLFAPLYSRYKPAAYALSTALFSLAHVIGYIGTYDLQTLLLCFLQYIPPSLCLAWIYGRSKNIFVSMLVHTAVNTLGLLILR